MAFLPHSSEVALSEEVALRLYPHFSEVAFRTLPEALAALGMSAWLPVQAQPGDASHAGSDGLGAQLQQQRPTATPALLASLASLPHPGHLLPTPALKAQEPSCSDSCQLGQLGPASNACVAALLVL